MNTGVTYALQNSQYATGVVGGRRRLPRNQNHMTNNVSRTVSERRNIFLNTNNSQLIYSHCLLPKKIISLLVHPLKSLADIRHFSSLQKTLSETKQVTLKTDSTAGPISHIMKQHQTFQKPQQHYCANRGKRTSVDNNRDALLLLAASSLMHFNYKHFDNYCLHPITPTVS